jgi:hypothetical protein
MESRSSSRAHRVEREGAAGLWGRGGACPPGGGSQRAPERAAIEGCRHAQGEDRPGEIRVVGAVYELDSGRVRWLSD